MKPERKTKLLYNPEENTPCNQSIRLESNKLEWKAMELKKKKADEITKKNLLRKKRTGSHHQVSPQKSKKTKGDKDKKTDHSGGSTKKGGSHSRDRADDNRKRSPSKDRQESPRRSQRGRDREQQPQVDPRGVIGYPSHP